MRGILGVEPAFDRVPARFDRREPERRAARHQDLLAYEIETRDPLGDRMLDLQTRVHLEEVEVALRIEQELDRAGADVVDRGRGADGGVGHRGPERRVDGG